MVDVETRRIEVDEAASIAPKSGTGPFDLFIPWVVEFRIMGTLNILQVQINEGMVIGRTTGQEIAGPEIDLSPFNAHYLGISRQHALLSARNSRVTITDLGSSNGTYIDHGRLIPHKEYRLRHGDRLTLGQMQFQVSFVLVPSSSETTETNYVNITIPSFGEGRRVMLVEDDERMMETTGYVLDRAGFVVESVSTVSDAIIGIDREMPDILATEILLPDQSGLNLVNYLRQHDPEHKVPVIVVSSLTGGYQRDQVMSAGADVFLSKPVGVDQIMEGLRSVLA